MALPWQVPGSDPNSTQLPPWLQQAIQSAPTPMPSLAPQPGETPQGGGIGAPPANAAGAPPQAPAPAKVPEDVKATPSGAPPAAPEANPAAPVEKLPNHIMTREEFDAQHKAVIPSAPVGPFDKIPEGQPGADSWGNRHTTLRKIGTLISAFAAEYGGRDPGHTGGHPGEGTAVLQPWLQSEAAKRQYAANAPAEQDRSQQKEYEDYVKNEVQKSQANYYNQLEGKGLKEGYITDMRSGSPTFGQQIPNKDLSAVQQSQVNEKNASANLKNAQGNVTTADIALKNAQAEYEKYKMDPNSWMAKNAAAHLQQAQANFELANQKFNFTRSNDFNKVYVDPINKGAEQSFRMMQQAYQEYKDAAANGEELPTGAQSMLALSSHLQTTFGVVKGARVTKDMIAEHLGARGLTDKAVVAVQTLVNGDQLSPDQWEAFTNLVSQSRNLQWQIAAETAHNRGLDPNEFLPSDLRGAPNPMGGAPSTPAGPQAATPSAPPKQAAPAAGGFDWSKAPVRKP